MFKNLNSDINYYILSFLDINKLHKIRIINKKTKKLIDKTFLRLSYIYGYLIKSKEKKISILINPNPKNLNILKNLKGNNLIKFKKNFYKKINVNIIKTNLIENKIVLYNKNEKLEIKL